MSAKQKVRLTDGTDLVIRPVHPYSKRAEGVREPLIAARNVLMGGDLAEKQLSIEREERTATRLQNTADRLAEALKRTDLPADKYAQFEKDLREIEDRIEERLGNRDKLQLEWNRSTIQVIDWCTTIAIWALGQEPHNMNEEDVLEKLDGPTAMRVTQCVLGIAEEEKSPEVDKKGPLGELGKSISGSDG